MTQQHVSAVVSTVIDGRRRHIRLNNVSTMEQVTVAMLRRGIYLFAVRWVRRRRPRPRPWFQRVSFIEGGDPWQRGA